MGSDGHDVAGSLTGTGTSATPSPRRCTSTSGDRAASRNIGVDDADESMIIEQVGGSATDATIKVTAYGRSNTYQHVSKIDGDFAGGNDNVIISRACWCRSTSTAAPATTSISYAAATTATRRWRTATCRVRRSPAARRRLHLGLRPRDPQRRRRRRHPDAHRHGRGQLNGDGGNDKLFGSSTDDQLSGGDGDDVLVRARRNLLRRRR